MPPRTIRHLVTHSGAFHADDACAYAILSDLHPDATLTRTRDADTITTLGKEGIVFDVGRQYNPDAGQYDHHQPGAPVREDGLSYAAFGLVWKHRGHEWLTRVAGVPEAVAGGVHAHMAEGFVRHIDTVDVGAFGKDFPLSASLPGIIHAMNPPSMGLDGTPQHHGPDVVEAQFRTASQMARGAILGEAHTVAREQVAEKLVVAAAHKRTHPSILVLDQPMPWEAAVIKRPETADVLLVVSPNSGGTEWGISCARKTLDTFESRRLLPEAWRGKTHDDLAQASGVPGVHFCHTAGFFAASTRKEAAVGFAHRAADTWAHEDRRDRAKTKAREEAPAPARPRATPRNSRGERE